ncbi:FAD-dependent oxidoreductase [Amycolatopsis taiwanensis]|uniref:FAD/NAD(P)-binding domain-containing protein n=1 Tax=Amycolatopsis taiwanensis TaxID=342230 RepID=A0A9W6R912_9PSEU|nr:FAD/NAD(P)-binding oxidoreductase [Amycolatopsis taiwanensis]GLY71128.1 hypothetical protein Atai01_77470 [Amycolatopsis taiwanensis]
MNLSDDVLVVGAFVGGLTLAEALRRKGFAGRIRIVGEEPHPPYGWPPLSKEILTGRWPVEKVFLRDQGRLDALEVDWLLGRRAERLRTHQHTVELDGGEVLSYGVVVIATGLVPRALRGQPGLAGVRTLAASAPRAAWCATRPIPQTLTSKGSRR